MKQIIIGIATFILLQFTFTANAETNACVSGDTTEIYFVNGVWNSLAQARDGRNLIKTAYKQTLETQYSDQKFEFKLAYNYSAGKVRDLIEVIGAAFAIIVSLTFPNVGKSLTGWDGLVSSCETGTPTKYIEKRLNEDGIVLSDLCKVVNEN